MTYQLPIHCLCEHAPAQRLGARALYWDLIDAVSGPPCRALAFRWNSGCLEENVITAVPDEKLEALIIDPTDEKTGYRLRSLQDRLGTHDKQFETIRAKAGAALRTVMINAALGRIPPDKSAQAGEYKSHAQSWFKTRRGGHELAEKVIALGLWHTFRQQLLPFCNAVLQAVDLPTVDDLPTT